MTVAVEPQGRPVHEGHLSLSGISVLAALGLAVPGWGWGQSNAFDKVAPPAGAPIRLSALHPEQMEELRGRPVLVYNLTSW